jgi:hypothetical protein
MLFITIIKIYLHFAVLPHPNQILYQAQMTPAVTRDLDGCAGQETFGDKLTMSHGFRGT